ncbi:MAG: competence/damage-inducible protein A [Candidatus Limnocylindria bacterium]
MTGDPPPGAELLSIGTELLLGETVDTNAAFLGAELAGLGLPLQQVRALPDDRVVIAAAFVKARMRCAVVLATGGLGPTHDDLTREGLADALGETLTEDKAVRAELEARFRAYGRMPASNLRQAMLVPSADVLANPIGSAPGWWVDRDGAVTVLMPGVPAEMRRMWAEQVRPRLERRFALAPLAIRTVKAFGIGESAAAERLGDLLDAPPDGVEAGIYARDDGIHVRFSTRSHAGALDACVERTLDALGVDAYGTDADDLPSAALLALGRRGVTTLATWEAGTDGALLAILAATRTDGAARFVGGLLEAGGATGAGGAGGDPGAPSADAVLGVSLLAQDAAGRSRVRVSLSGALAIQQTEVRIHGSGPQRLRRAAFAALDVVRRELSSSGR